MSRQVLSTVFPFLKADWGLTDTKLGTLTSVVSLTVGILAVPLSLLSDRWGRSRAIIAMAALWSLATVGSALAADYQQLLISRFFVGLGEAAYGSVGLAVVLAVFPPSKRASLSGAFMAAGSFGSVVGTFLGGILAQHLGWRWSLGAMAIIGLVLVAAYAVCVNDAKITRNLHPGNAEKERQATAVKRAPLRTLVSTPSVICAYLGSGFQLFVAGTIFGWMPSYLNRAYHMPPGKAGVAASGFILLMAAGMVVCGMVTDRLTRNQPGRKWSSGLAYTSLSLVLLGSGFALKPGTPQLLLVAIGTFFSAGVIGAATAMVANLTSPSIQATAFGTLTFANNLLGLAAGPVVTGILADHLGLAGAMRLAPLASVPAIIALALGWRFYPGSIRRVATAGSWPSS
jgi:MFS family permease